MRKQVNYPHTAQFMVRKEEGSVHYLYAKYEDADSSFRSNVKGSPKKIKIGSLDLGRANLGVVYGTIRRRVPSCTSVPNLKRIALFVRKL